MAGGLLHIALCIVPALFEGILARLRVSQELFYEIILRAMSGALEGLQRVTHAISRVLRPIATSSAKTEVLHVQLALYKWLL
mmetsp:Transcript_1025/g.2619  ORF Transcript_1025/g.2619 Transcript_1025/m.2619 type:complete len:82 (-) Transcript_1025:23-268(-)